MSTYHHYRYDAVRRLESAGSAADLGRGLAAEVADPVWLLGRQWQLGELAGEDAASPVRVSYTEYVTPIGLTSDLMSDAPDHAADHAADLTPPEALVESEPEEWWTVGRRVRLGRSVAAAVEGDPDLTFPDDDAHLRLGSLPVPYQRLEGAGYDGRELWRRRVELGLDHAWFSPTPPAEPDDLWDAAELAYDADFTAGGAVLTLRRHDGGDLDWFSVDAEGPVQLTAAEAEHRTTLCSRLRYPGAPTPRWWEIDEAGLDIGGQAPDRAHFATLLMIELLTSHTDDWFTFAVDTRPGHVVTLEDVEVTDSFGDVWPLALPSDGWSLYAVRGLHGTSLVVWPTVASPLVGPLLDEVVLEVDEDADRLWAVERRIAGRDVATDPVEPPVAERVDTGDRRRFRYRPSTPTPEHWHPYVLDETPQLDSALVRRRYVQGRLADLSSTHTAYIPVPTVDLLYDRHRGEGDPVHHIEPAAVPRSGLRLERRYVLGRRSDGTPVLWSERRRAPIAAPPGLPLHLDVLEDAPPRGKVTT
jgi:hypothetical protein